MNAFFGFDMNSVPPEEHESAKFIEQNLRALERGAEAFRRAVDLYMHIRELARANAIDVPTKIAWTRIVGRDGAIEAHGFAMIMELIGEGHNKAPTVWAKIDIASKKSATSLFSSEFPRVTGVRNSSAHPGKLSGSAKELERHRLKEAVEQPGWQMAKGSGLFIGEAMDAHDDKLNFSATYKGTLATYELSYPKAQALKQVADLYFTAFRPLEHPVAALRREQDRQLAELRKSGWPRI